MAYPHERSYVPVIPEKPSWWTRFKQWFTHRVCESCKETGPRREMKDIPFGGWRHKECDKKFWNRIIEKQREEDYNKMVYEEKQRLKARKQAKKELEASGEL